MPRHKDPLESIFPWGSDSEEDESPRSRSPCDRKSLHHDTYVSDGIQYSLLPGTAQSGRVLAHCMDCIQKLREATGGQSLAIYKIGITHNCQRRFELYKVNGWGKMLVMFETADLGLLEMLEAALISHHRSNVQCRNVLKGGEGMRDVLGKPKFQAPFYCYCTAARADLPRWVV